MTIEVIRKEVYGNKLTYVKDESVRNSIRKLTGRKTLTVSDIEALKELFGGSLIFSFGEGYISDSFTSEGIE